MTAQGRTGTVDDQAECGQNRPFAVRDNFCRPELQPDGVFDIDALKREATALPEGLVVEVAERSDRLGIVGSEGVVEDDLDPEGVVLVSSEQWSARSVAGPLPRGTRVRVVGVDRLRLDVEPIKEQATAVPLAEGGKP